MVNFINGRTPINDVNLNKMQTDLQTNIITGQEIETNEYLDNRRIYLKRINFGLLPNASTKNISTGLNVNSITVCKPISGYAINVNQMDILTFPDIAPNYAEGATRLKLNLINSIYNISITTGIDRSEYNAYVEIYYIKNNE